MENERQMLHVDLADRRIWKEPLAGEMRKEYIGSRGINAALLWRELKPGSDPLSPENPLIFGPGLLTGSHVPSSGRTTVTCKGPATNLYLKTNVGGHWGAALRFAGYDHLVVHGRSEAPVYIYVEDERVEIRPAGHLWGKDVRQTTKLLQQELGGGDVEIACIGQGGENLVRFAAIMFSVYNAAGRGGAGAVMGSKRLKAIAVRGKGLLRPAQPERLGQLVEKVRENLKAVPQMQRLAKYGTSNGLEGVNELHALPTLNYQRGYFEGASRISGPYLVEAGYLKRRVACFSCPIGCHRYAEVRDGPFARTFGGGPEYETLASLGAGVGVDDVEAILKANELCNIYGLDTISTGSVIQWLIESRLHGAINSQEADGLDLKWGDGQLVTELVRRIAFREGIGDLLAEGVRRAAEKVGGDSYKWAVEAKGLEQSRVETRSMMGYALSFAVNPRGPDHLTAQLLAETGFRPEQVRLIEKITGDAKYANPYLLDKRAEIVVWHEHCYAISDCLGICSFPTTSLLAVDPALMAELFSAWTGEEVSEQEITQAGERVWNLERCFNVREGATRADDRLPWRLMHEELPDRPGAINSPEALNTMLNEYYDLRGWDRETGWPTRETLEDLGLCDVAEELGCLEKLA